MYFKTFVASVLLTLGVAANPLASRAACVVLSPGKYTISLAATGWQLRPFHHAFAPPAIESHQDAPTGQLGVWSLTNAPQSAYYISNVGEGNVVSTLSFSGLQPYTTSVGGAVAFAIQCAGNGTYVIKNPTADEVWNAEPDAWVKIIGAKGDISQRFLFQKV
ncbi:hypothetical protein GALMADRAFT_249966 [Galerina marginata CBS 339.88]|uniref:Ricin B lectin domain-containing protein n=1 Tax=Galerina marginata (strain CBS 339.88) TaxID=685588 RepID=A0A067T2Q1_GALM3|nr:hypothetical protein GALMADRAFT_249966 [Galerina marginata CBS 339.88]